MLSVEEYVDGVFQPIREYKDDDEAKELFRRLVSLREYLKGAEVEPADMDRLIDDGVYRCGNYEVYLVKGSVNGELG